MRVRPGRWAFVVCLASVLLSAIAPQRGAAQACPQGKFCFYVPPGLPYEGSHSSMATRTFDLVLSAPMKTVSGTYAIAGGEAQRFSVSPGASYRIALPGASGHASAYGTVETGGVFLVADAADLTVDHREVFDSEQYSETIKRHSIALGSRFRLAGYALDGEGRPNAGVDAVLIYAPTGGSVTLTAPPGATLPFWSSTTQSTLTVTLREGQTVALRTLVARNLDGALLTSTQPVAVSSGGRGWSQANCGDDGMDGLVPVSALGTEYAVRMPTGSAPPESRVRVIADAADTVVRVNGQQVAVLAAGAFFTFTPSALSYVQTSKPALVWMNGSLSGCELETALIPPLAFAPALTSLSLDFNVLSSNQMPPAELAILIATRDVASIRLDGQTPQVTSSTPVPTRADLSYVRFNVGTGDRNVRAGSDFQALLATRTAPSGLLAYYNPFRIPGCGDSGADPGEGCDDGNLDDGDGCSSTCQAETGFVCEKTPSECRTVCGDSQIGAPIETCDDGNAVGGDGCNTTCRPELTVLAPADATSTTDATPTFNGTADPGAMVRIEAGNQTGMVTADAQGSWTFTPNAPITDGMRTIVITATDVRGGVSSAMRTLTIDTGTVLTLDAPRPNDLTRDSTPTFSGTGELGSSVEVRVDGVSVGITMVMSDRTWSLTPTTPLSAGTKQAVATATDALQNTISTTPVSFTIDDQTQVTIAAPAADEVLTSAQLRAHGTGEPSARIALSVRDASGTTHMASSLVQNDGQWTLEIKDALANGRATATATVTDTLGNTATAEVAFTVDASTRVALEQPTEGAVLRTTTPEIRGTGEPGASVVLRVDGAEIGRATVDPQGAYVVVTTALGEGPHLLRAEATDEGGATASAERHFSIDVSTRIAVSQPMNAAVLTTATPELSGTGEAGSTAEVWVDGAMVGTATIMANGTWTFPLAAPLGDGAHVVEVRTTDPVGNQAQSRQEFRTSTRRLELHNPPENTRLRDGAVTISGVALPSALVSVEVDGVLVDTMRASGVGSWAMQLISTLAPGPHTVRVSTASDQRVTTGEAHTFVVDPAALPLTLLEPAEGSVTADATPVIAGTGQPRARIAVSVDATALGDATAGPDGLWTIEVTTPLPDGSRVARAVVQDGSGDSPAVAAGFHVDTHTEVRVQRPAADAVVGSPVPYVRGSAELGGTVDLTVDGDAVASVDVAIDGSWITQLTRPLSPGVHTLHARATDRLENVAELDVRFRYDPAKPDSDGDGRFDLDECAGGTCPDSDGDGVPDRDDPDDDGDGIPSAYECATLPCVDSDGDGIPDVLDADDDADGIPTSVERMEDGAPRDTDRDGIPDHLDPDDDGDSVPTREECSMVPCPDGDGDGLPDSRAPDDDGDGLPTARERADAFAFGLDDDLDGDLVPNWLDRDANGNAVLDGIEGFADANGDGVVDYVGTGSPTPEITIDDPEDAYTIAGGSGCSTARGAGSAQLWVLALLLLCRRRRQDRDEERVTQSY